MFYDRFKELCDLKGVRSGTACTEMGFSRSLASKWKNTKTEKPSAEVLEKMSVYFNMSINEILGVSDIKKEPATVFGDKLTQEIIEKLTILNPENRSIALAQIDFLVDRQEKQDT